MRHFRFALPLILLIHHPAATPAGKTKQPAGPPAPKEVQATFKIEPGLRIELVACEPQIESPVAVAFGEDGKLWVVEMRDYPNGPAKGEKPAGRIRVLEDRDGDGSFERSTVFADHLLFANGLMPWRDGVIVTAAPHVVWLRDTDGDGKADKREVLYEGFATQNPQLRVSHPVLGLDNWVYVANGLRGGQVRAAGQPDAKPVNLSGMDFRFDLLRERHEAVSGLGQFGNAFDDWGRRFVCDNRHHLRHVVIESRYLKRNPFLAAPDVVEDISELEPGPLSSGGKVYPLSKNWTTSSLHAGRFTAACGVLLYRDALLGEKHRGTALTCEPTGNLVHQEKLTPRGATFSAKPTRDKVEFLATAEEWFRPVFLSHGPDGALYVVDMCRAVIEHPEFMPPELKNRPDLTLGKDRGRIWRIVPEGHKTKAVRPALGKATTADLVKLLERPETWWRTTAQRLLLQRRDADAVKHLRELLSDTKSPLAKAHAARLLLALDALDPGIILAFLRDAEPRLREQGILLAEPDVRLIERAQKEVAKLAEDPDARVRYQVALTLGEWKGDEVVAPLAKIAAAGAEDRWTRLAVASAVPTRAGALLGRLFKDGSLKPAGGYLLLVQELAALVGARRDAGEVVAALDTLNGLKGEGAVAWQTAGLIGVADGMGRRGGQLAAFLKSLPEKQRDTASKTAALLERAAARARDGAQPAPARADAIRLLAHAPWDTARPALVALLAADQPQEIRLPALRALAAHREAEVAGLLLKPWRAYTPALRKEATEALMRQPDRVRALLKEMEAGNVRPGDLDAQRTRQLLNSPLADVRDKAKKLLQNNLPADRKRVLETYGKALSLKSDPQRGKEVFKKNCATCHRVAGIGVDVGPDVADTRTKTPEALLIDILSPNAAIDNNYVDYLVTTKDGRTLTGLIATETAASITLRRAENQTETVLRQDIDSIRSSGVSLMPEGLEKTITVQEMADLIDFLKNWRYLDGSVPRN